jgi:hypothetical protein
MSDEPSISRESTETFLQTLADPSQTPASTLDILTRATARRRHRPSYRLCREAGRRREGPFDRKSIHAAIEWIDPDLVDHLFDEHDRRVAVCNTVPYILPRPPVRSPRTSDSERSHMPVTDLNAPKQEARYAPGSRNPEALQAHEQRKRYTTGYTVAAIRGYLLATVQPENLLQFAYHIQEQNQGWDHADHRQVDAMRADIAKLVPEYAPLLCSEVEGLSDKQLESLTSWARMQGRIEGDQPGKAPELLIKLPVFQQWLTKFVHALDAYPDRDLRPDRLCPYNWTSYGPMSAGPMGLPALAPDPHPVIRLWLVAVNAAQNIPVSYGATNLADAWRIL